MFVIVATALHVSSIIINDSMAFQTITKKILANNYVEFQRMCDEQKKAMNRTNIAMALAMNLSSKEDFVEYRWKEVLHNKAIAVQHIADRAEIEGKTINKFRRQLFMDNTSFENELPPSLFQCPCFSCPVSVQTILANIQTL